jgi:predicted house-cleaning NTP pyrophosphatase (Maf/HAM1 superfamily)
MDVYQSEVDSDKGEPALVIAADTIVVSRNGEILEKPRSEADHIMMLKMLRDTDIHKVYTAVALMKPMESAKDPGYELETCVEETTVKFDEAGKLLPLKRLHREEGLCSSAEHALIKVSHPSSAGMIELFRPLCAVVMPLC